MVAAAAAQPDQAAETLLAPGEHLRAAAELLRRCAHVPDERGDGGSGGEPTSTGEPLVWWYAPRQQSEIAHDALSGVAEAHTDLLMCLATLRDGATVSRLRAGIEDAMRSRAAQLEQTLCATVAGASIEHACTLVRGGDALAAAASSGSGVGRALLLSPTLNRWVTAATLVYAATALRLRLCVVDYTRTRAEAQWIAHESCGEHGGGGAADDSADADDIACVARFGDGRWGVLTRDDATRTFSREADLPFALALVYATTGRGRRAA